MGKKGDKIWRGREMVVNGRRPMPVRTSAVKDFQWLISLKSQCTP